MIDCVGLQVLILSVNCQCVCPALGFGSIQVVGLVLIWSGERLAAKLFGIFIGWPNTGLWDPTLRCCLITLALLPFATTWSGRQPLADTRFA